jgi:hypothetical protein
MIPAFICRVRIKVEARHRFFCPSRRRGSVIQRSLERFLDVVRHSCEIAKRSPKALRGGLPGGLDSDVDKVVAGVRYGVSTEFDVWVFHEHIAQRVPQGVVLSAYHKGQARLVRADNFNLRFIDCPIAHFCS